MIHVQRELAPDGVQAGSGEKREINVKEKKKTDKPDSKKDSSVWSGQKGSWSSSSYWCWWREVNQLSPKWFRKELTTWINAFPKNWSRGKNWNTKLHYTRGCGVRWLESKWKTPKWKMGEENWKWTTILCGYHTHLLYFIYCIYIYIYTYTYR